MASARTKKEIKKERKGKMPFYTVKEKSPTVKFSRVSPRASFSPKLSFLCLEMAIYIQSENNIGILWVSQASHSQEILDVIAPGEARERKGAFCFCLNIVYSFFFVFFFWIVMRGGIQAPNFPRQRRSEGS